MVWEMFQMHDRNFTTRFSKFSTVLKSFVLATFAEKAGRAMEGLSLFSLCLSCKELLWTRGGVMKGALGGGKEGVVNSIAISSFAAHAVLTRG